LYITLIIWIVMVPTTQLSNKTNVARFEASLIKKKKIQMLLESLDLITSNSLNVLWDVCAICGITHLPHSLPLLLLLQPHQWCHHIAGHYLLQLILNKKIIIDSVWQECSLFIKKFYSQYSYFLYHFNHFFLLFK
jgi:hypothetical protein